MTEINTAHLINQLQNMASKAESSISFTPGDNTLNFSSALQNALNKENQLIQNEESLKTRFELGDPNVSLGEVMIATQEARLGLEALVVGRNKAVQAYQDIINMPV